MINNEALVSLPPLAGTTIVACSGREHNEAAPILFAALLQDHPIVQENAADEVARLDIAPSVGTAQATNLDTVASGRAAYTGRAV